jgi:hypothetical protein
MKRIGVWSLALVGFVFAMGFGKWAQSLFTKSELMHFSVNFPSEGRAETMSCCNVGTQPYRIRIEMEMCDLETEWLTFEADWDQATQESTRYVEPGDTFNMDWFFRIPDEVRAQATVCDGELRVLDADTGDLLTDLPVRIVNSKAN